MTKFSIRHGHSADGRTTSTYNSWAGMFQRCDNPRNAAYIRYGARGIKVCREWYEFERFLADMGMRPAGTTLDRIDVNDGYRPGNCRWATAKQQSENKTNNVAITIDGETNPLSVWCEMFGINYKTASNRIRLGWDPVEAVSADLRFDPRPFGNIEVLIGGVTRTVNEWCALNGIKYRTAYTRVHSLGWDLQCSVSVPPGPNGSSSPKNTKKQRCNAVSMGTAGQPSGVGSSLPIPRAHPFHEQGARTRRHHGKG